MDPVSVFNALYDTNCLKFGRFELKSGLVAPYYLNLRRLALYPKLMDAVATHVVEKFLKSPVSFAGSKGARQSSARQQVAQNEKKKNKSASPSESDADSQMEDELETSSDDGDCENVCNSEPILCGVPYGAIPLATAIACKAQLPCLFERKEAKSYGDKQSLMDGYDAEQCAPNEDGQRITTKNDKTTQARAKRHRVILIEDVICSGQSILEAVESLESQNLKVDFVICIVDREENGIKLLEQAGVRVVSLYNISAILRILETTGRIGNEQFLNIKQWMSRNHFETIGVDPTVKQTSTIKATSN